MSGAEAALLRLLAFRNPREREKTNLPRSSSAPRTGDAALGTGGRFVVSGERGKRPRRGGERGAAKCRLLREQGDLLVPHWTERLLPPVQLRARDNYLSPLPPSLSASRVTCRRARGASILAAAGRVRAAEGRGGRRYSIRSRGASARTRVGSDPRAASRGRS
ncbi:hypothetical protein NL676_000764 [Syzygium grande]|nr:hypothetical protein NL676_000764 [Syzygium grande]